MQLTQHDIEFFHREGYLVAPNILAENTINDLCMSLDRRVRQSVRRNESREVRDLAGTESFDRLLARLYEWRPADAVAIVHQLRWLEGGRCTNKDREVFDFITHPRILDLLTPLIGGDIVASAVYRIRPKLPHHPADAVPWHQDAAYFSPNCDDSLIVTCWIPLVAARKENGCLFVLPRRHQQGLLRHVPTPGRPLLAIKDSSMAGLPRAVALEVDVGAVVLLSNFTPHFSLINRSDRVRWSVDMRYQSLSAPNNLSVNANELGEKQRFTLGCYPPEADFVARCRSGLVPETTFSEFIARRDSFEQVQLVRNPPRSFNGRGE